MKHSYNTELFRNIFYGADRLGKIEKRIQTSQAENVNAIYDQLNNALIEMTAINFSKLSKHYILIKS